MKYAVLCQVHEAFEEEKTNNNKNMGVFLMVLFLIVVDVLTKQCFIVRQSERH